MYHTYIDSYFITCISAIIPCIVCHWIPNTNINTGLKSKIWQWIFILSKCFYKCCYLPSSLCHILFAFNILFIRIPFKSGCCLNRTHGNIITVISQYRHIGMITQSVKHIIMTLNQLSFDLSVIKWSCIQKCNWLKKQSPVLASWSFNL